MVLHNSILVPFIMILLEKLHHNHKKFTWNGWNYMFHHYLNPPFSDTFRNFAGWIHVTFMVLSFFNICILSSVTFYFTCVCNHNKQINYFFFVFVYSSNAARFIFDLYRAGRGKAEKMYELHFLLYVVCDRSLFL